MLARYKFVARFPIQHIPSLRFVKSEQLLLSSFALPHHRTDYTRSIQQNCSTRNQLKNYRGIKLKIRNSVLKCCLITKRCLFCNKSGYISLFMITFRKSITSARLFIAVSGFCCIPTTCHSSVLCRLLYFSGSCFCSTATLLCAIAPSSKFIP